MSDKIRHAFYVAVAAHWGQFDRGGAPRHDHVAHVSAQFADDTHQIVALLHDTIEDSPLVSLNGIGQVFGVEIQAAVDAITRRSGELYFDYINRCKQNPIARAVKIEDILHNSDKSRWPDMPDSYAKREVKALAILKGES